MFHLSETSKDQARATALRIVINGAGRILSDRSSKDSEIKGAVLSLMAFDWTPSLARTIGSRDLNRIFRLLRDGVIPPDEYILFRDMITHATDESIPLQHTQWRIWHELIVRFHLFEIAPIADWVSLIARLDSRGIRTPGCLHGIPFSDFVKTDWESDNPDMILMLWQAARTLVTRGATSAKELIVPDSSDLQNLIISLRKDHISSTDTIREYESLKRELDLPPGYENLSAAAKAEALNRPDIRPTERLKVLDLAARRNVIRAFAGSLRPAASGMQSYLNFCHFARREPFPISSDSVRLWSGFFRPGKTYGLYLAHLMKASILLDQPTDWITPDIRAVSRGLKNAQDLSFRFQNFMFADGLLALLRFAKLDNEFGLASFLSFLLLLRVPSETLLMRLADDEDRITEFSPQNQKILAGIRRIRGEPMLVVKFSWRKNIKRGCILRRPCLCDERGVLARTLCPIHRIWPELVRGCRPHGYLFPSLSASIFNRTLKRVLVDAGFSNGSRYSSHCFRRGATQELQVQGNSEGTLKSAGCWNGMGFRSYIDTQLTDALKISRIVASLSDSESDDETRATLRVAADEGLRKKLRKFPGGETSGR